MPWPSPRHVRLVSTLSPPCVRHMPALCPWQPWTAMCPPALCPSCVRHAPAQVLSPFSELDHHVFAMCLPRVLHVFAMCPPRAHSLSAQVMCPLKPRPRFWTFVSSWPAVEGAVVSSSKTLSRPPVNFLGIHFGSPNSAFASAPCASKTVWGLCWYNSFLVSPTRTPPPVILPHFHFPWPSRWIHRAKILSNENRWSQWWGSDRCNKLMPVLQLSKNHWRLNTGSFPMFANMSW